MIDWKVELKFALCGAFCWSEEMGWNCMVAYVKSIERFGSNPNAMQNALTHRSSTANPTSCYATMGVLHEMMCTGTSMSAHSTTGAEAKFMPSKAVDTMAKLVKGDNAIFVSVAPDHHFTVLPLSDSDVAILQGFQGCYNIHQWITESGKVPMKTNDFMDNFAKFFSQDKGTRVPAAIVLFATPSTVDDIAEYFGSQPSFVKSFSSAGLDLFRGDTKASLTA